jgi:hypothetical protein
MFSDSSGTIPDTFHRPAPLLSLFRPKPVGSWMAIGTVLFFFLLCWAAFFAFVEPAWEGTPTQRIEADSSTYFVIAGLLPETDAYSSNSQLISFRGNLFGPVLIAKTLRNPFFVVIFNCLLFVAMTQTAGLIPGVRRRIFCLLMALNAQTLVSIATLNKEILASFGLVALMASRLGNRHRKLLLFVAFTLSLMARWEQVAIVLIFILLESRFSPFRNRHKLSLLSVTLALGVAYSLAIRLIGFDLASFLAQAEGAGILTTLNKIQASFGFPLVVIPKAMLNLFNRTITPTYFFSDAYLSEGFGDLSNQVIIHLQCLAMTVLFVAAVWKRRLLLSRPIPYFMALYVIVTSLSPFVQARYEYPIYALLCIELARTKESFDTDRVAKRRFSILPAAPSPEPQPSFADRAIPT